MRRLAFTALFLTVFLPFEAVGEDRRAGYYYPAVTSEEVFVRDVLGDVPRAARGLRVGFITQLTLSQAESPKPARFAIFAKGSEAEHMIIVALDDEVFATLYRARAVLAQLTAAARVTDFFRDNDIQDQATWFDLAKVLGFEDLVISDGATWAHRVSFE